ncbi:ATP-binding protein [uncultured Winogradskyella sp.]|uniref:sensor histidine kinase n=1 Tax=uncultured Winogradskyella sp. TaxID=395353 RepID=UPI0030EBB304|tara:strand:- start:4728 stop:6125 length:1398 start_codon:yes stop_codon:yes gene_type:complete
MIKKLWNSYLQRYSDYCEFPLNLEKEDLTYYRDKLFVSILLLTLVLGIISYVPSAAMAVVLDKWFVLYIDTFAILMMLLSTFIKRISLKLRKLLFSSNLFILSACLIIDLGLNGNGTILLFIYSVYITLYSGRKAGLYSVLLSALLYVFVLLIYDLQWLELNMLRRSDFLVLVITFTNNIMFSLLTVFSISFLIDQLHAGLLKQSKLQIELIEKHKNVLIAKERAEQSDQLKSAFLANISHEVRTPMYGILGSAELLKDYEADNNKDFKEFVSIIEQNGSKLLDVISGILNISEIETGVMRINVSKFNINDTITTVYEQFLPEAELKEVQFRIVNKISDAHKIIQSDQAKIAIILKKLIENAIKFTSKGDKIILNAAFDDLRCHFSIEDTGIGVPEDKIDTIFNPFYQVDITNKNALHGSGIGLSIAKAYVKLLGGNLTLESNEGEGSTFMFSIVSDLENNYKKK